MSYFGPGGTPLICTAGLEAKNDAVAARKCVMAHGHYLDDGPGGRSWHTDCEGARGKDHPPDDHYEHNHDHYACVVWADHADGAFYQDRPAVPAEQGTRSLTDLGEYRADVVIGDTKASVYGPAKFVAFVVRAVADAFEEEAER